MRLRVISARNEIPNLNPNEKTVHLAFRASNVDFLNLMQRCPRLRMIQVPPSYRKTMSNAIQVFLEMQGVEMLEGDVWGHRKDLDEYFTVDDSTLEEIRCPGRWRRICRRCGRSDSEEGQDQFGADQVHRQDQDYLLSPHAVQARLTLTYFIIGRFSSSGGS